MSVAETQGPIGSSVVIVKKIEPFASSAAVGKYSAFGSLEFGVYVPLPPLQVMEDAAPPKDPCNKKDVGKQ